MEQDQYPPPADSADPASLIPHRPLTILVMNHLPRWTASKSYSFKLARWLAERGHRVMYFGPGCSDLGDPRCEPLPESVSFVQSPPMTNARVPVQAIRLARLIRERRIDVLHANLPIDHNLALFAKLLAGRPVALVRTKHFLRPLKNSYSPISRIKYSRLTDRMLTTCRAIAEVLASARCVDPRKIRIVYEGLDLARYAPGVRANGYRAELSIPADAPLVGMVASFRDTKAHGDFVEAAARIRSRVGNVRFLISGEGDRTIAQRIRADVSRLGLADAVTITGFRPDVTAILADLALGVVPSTESDAAGRICMEYLASGTPAVVTDIGAYPEIVSDGEVGCVVPPARPDRIADAVCALLLDQDRLSTMRRAARLRAEQMFARETFVERIETVYREALAEHRRTPLVAAV